MQRVFSFRQGDRSEYLAQYILSAFAISVPVPRQEDVGSDFHCSLLRREGKTLYPYLPFNIQIKSYGPDLLKKGVRFGGITKGKKPKGGKWRKHEIDILCQADMPFLVGVVNKDKQWLDIFTTVPRYLVIAESLKRETPREVRLMPYSPGEEVFITECHTTELDERPEMPSFSLDVPIGQPIVRITIEDSEDHFKCEKIKELLEPYLRLDQQNAVLNRIGIGYFDSPIKVETGEPLDERNLMLYYEPSEKRPSRGLIETLYKVVASTLTAYKNIGDKESIEPWLPVLEQPSNGRCDPRTQQALEEVLKFATD